MYRLVATYAGGMEVFQVPDDEAKLGASPDNDLVLPVRGISRRHALVRRCPGGIEVTDLGSKNGLLVEGWRVERAVLTPGLRVQIGEAFFELQEVSTEDVLSAGEASLTEQAGATASAEGLSSYRSSYADALRLAYHLDCVGVGHPGRRSDLLARLRATLGAEVLLTGERRRREKILTIRESDGGSLPATESAQLNLLVGEPRNWSPHEVQLKRSGNLLVAGRGNLFLAIAFTNENFVREGWRKDLLRFLAERLLGHTPAIDETKAAALRRMLALTGGNKSETARRLKISRQTVYNFLRRSS